MQQIMILPFRAQLRWWGLRPESFYGKVLAVTWKSATFAATLQFIYLR